MALLSTSPTTARLTSAEPSICTASVCQQLVACSRSRAGGMALQGRARGGVRCRGAKSDIAEGARSPLYGRGGGGDGRVDRILMAEVFVAVGDGELECSMGPRLASSPTAVWPQR
jgi:hypothetical protein